MFKFVTLYRRVDDESALEQFFSETHLPLAEQLPNLRRTAVSRIQGKPGGQSRFHMAYELYFDSYEAYVAALATEVGMVLMQALRPWGEAQLITWFYAETYEEEPEGNG